MIQDVLTKFNSRKKLWMTPKHPFYLRDYEFKLYYGAALVLQAQRSKNLSALNNPELERILKPGLGLTADQISQVIRNSREESRVIDKLTEYIQSEKDCVILMLDLMDLSWGEGGWDQEAWEWIQLWARIMDMPRGWIEGIQEFIQNACQENREECQRLVQQMNQWGVQLSRAELKFYLMSFGETMQCTQSSLDEQREIRLVDNCEIREDLILEPGMRLILDHAEVRIYGNIALEGGVLQIDHSKIIRKSGSHRACINIHRQGGKVFVRNSEADCRNQGMFIRAEAGQVEVFESNIYRTTRGAAVRFWGDQIQILSTRFSECYSPEDGGALMLRGGKGEVRDCFFQDCEAKRGGAVYAVQDIKIGYCHFVRCCVAEYGAAVYYAGLIGKQVRHLEYEDCYPSGAELVQYLTRKGEFKITGEYQFNASTIVDCPLEIDTGGTLVTEGANLYLNYPVYCRGSLQMKDTRVVCGYLEKGDMIILEHARQCRIHHCEFDGMMRTGAISATGTRLQITKSVFRNTKGGRAVYNAYAPEIQDCIFNFCQGGAIYAQGGNIKRCVFVNCREKSGAGIRMYGMHGVIEQCNFKRCVAEFRGGAIDRGVGHQVVRCLFEECRPDNVH